MRILIAGVPRAGKTTLADWLSAGTGLHVRRTDDLIGLGWSESSLMASTWIDLPGDSIIEGVAVPRALRKWLARPSDTLIECVLWLDRPYAELTQGQSTMAKGCRTVWREIEPELVARGVRVERV